MSLFLLWVQGIIAHCQPAPTVNYYSHYLCWFNYSGQSLEEQSQGSGQSLSTYLPSQPTCSRKEGSRHVAMLTTMHPEPRQFVYDGASFILHTGVGMQFESQPSQLSLRETNKKLFLRMVLMFYFLHSFNPVASNWNRYCLNN